MGKTEWTDDEDEEEESVAENAPAVVAVDNTPASEEAPVVTENQAEENQEAETSGTDAPRHNGKGKHHTTAGRSNGDSGNRDNSLFQGHPTYHRH
mgnify:CR=1 FL=1